MNKSIHKITPQGNKSSMLQVMQQQRKSWGFSPVTRVVKDKTKYNRKKQVKTWE